MPQFPARHATARLSAYAALGLLLLFFGLAVDTAVSKTITIDEPAHIIRGVALWQRGDLRYQVGHMPLAHWFIGSLLQTDPALPRIDQLPSWPSDDRLILAEELLWGAGDAAQVQRFLFLARLPIIFAALLLGALLLNWSRRGSRSLPLRARLLIIWSSGLLFALSPNLTAHTALATTDGLTTVLYTAVIYALWHYYQRPSTPRWLLLSLLAGLALATKLTNLALLPIIFILHLWQVGWRNWRIYLPQFLQLGVAAAGTLWMVYLFELRPISSGLPPVPAATYFDSLLRVLNHVEQGHISFLLGERSAAGWWHYFAVAAAVKIPTAVLLLLAVAAVAAILRKRDDDAFTVPPRFFLITAAVLFLFASAVRLNIGFRHVLPVLPPLWLFIAFQMPRIWRWRGGRWLTGLLFAALITGVLRQHPHHLAYFNSFAGGSAHGDQVMGDSNLDWGQDLNLLRDYLQEDGRLPTIRLSYYGAADPAAYGFDRLLIYDPAADTLTFNPANPDPGLYAISVSHLQGLGLADPDLFDWFRRREPVAQLGYTINLYEVRENEADWIGICLDPGPIISPEDINTFLGTNNLRTLYFDCRQSWVVPDAGSRGYFVLPQQDMEAWFIGRQHPGRMELLYRHQPGRLGPSFDIYAWHGSLPPLPQVAPPLPADIAGVARLTGYALSGQDWWTSWQINESVAAPLTIAGHLYAGGPPPLVADSLGFPAEQWQPGDRLWQRFQFTQDGKYLETGLYNYLNGERVAPFVPLPNPDS